MNETLSHWKPGPLSIGWASRDVSTDQPVAIRGQFYLRISEGVLDPVSVTALALDNGEDAALFLSCDNVGIQAFLMTMIRDRVRRAEPSLPAGKIIVHATHAHSGGDLYEGPDAFPCALPRMPGEEYQAFFADRAAEALVEAWRSRRPGQVAWGFGYAVTSYSRRTVYFDDTAQRPGAVKRPGLTVNGHAVMYGKTNDPQFSHFEAGADPFVNLLYTFTPDGTLTGAIVNVPCPSQCSMHEWRLTADFWHEVRCTLQARHGAIFLLPQCAAAGDLETKVLHCQAAHERRLRLKGATQRQEIAGRIAAAFDEVLAWAAKDRRDHLVLAHRTRTVALTRRRITREEYDIEVRQLAQLEQEPFATEGDPRARLQHDSILASQRRRCQSVIRRFESQDAEPTLPMELHVVRLGDIALASNRFELYMDYMHRIQGRSPAVQTFIIQLAGSEAGEGGGTYLATRRGAEGRGYSASPYCNLVSPDGGQELVEETLHDLEALWQPPHDAPTTASPQGEKQA